MCKVIDFTEAAIREADIYWDISVDSKSSERIGMAEITIEQTNNNNVSGSMDLDGVVSGLTDAVNEAVDIITEGVHE